VAGYMVVVVIRTKILRKLLKFKTLTDIQLTNANAVRSEIVPFDPPSPEKNTLEPNTKGIG